MRPLSRPHPDAGRGKIATGVALVLAVLAGLVAFAPSAFAHHADDGSSVVCDPATGEWVITWRVTNPAESWNAAGPGTTERVMRISNVPAGVEFAPNPVARGASATAEQRIPGTAAGQQSISVTVTWEWQVGGVATSGHSRSTTLRVTPQGTCEVPEDPAVTLHLQKVVCEPGATIPANSPGAPDHRAGLLTWGALVTKPIGPLGALPAGCAPASGWQFFVAASQAAMGQDAEGNVGGGVLVPGSTGVGGVLTVSSSDLPAGLGDHLLRGNQLWVAEQYQSGYGFENLHCATDALNTDNLEYIQLNPQQLPTDVYCTAWNSRIPSEPDTWGFVVDKALAGAAEVVAPGHAFTVGISCATEGEPYTDSATFSVGSPAVFSGIPLDATPCTVTESAPSGGLPAGYTWAAPSYAPDAVVSIADTDGGCAAVDQGGLEPAYLLTAEVREELVVAGPVPCVTVTNTPVPPGTPPVITTPPAVSVSSAYECGPDGSVTVTSTGGATSFVVLVDGVVVAETGALSGTREIGFTIPEGGSATVVVRADGVEVFAETFTFDACVLAEVEEPPAVEPPAVEAEVVAPATPPATLPVTGSSSGLLAGIATLVLAAGLGLMALGRQRRTV